MKKIYLDNAATTQIDERVLESMLPYLKDRYGNPSSIHSWGREVKVMLEDARETIAKFIGAKPSEIFFTSGGTEANNFAIKGAAFAQHNKKNHIITTAIEHSAVLDTLKYLHTRFGFEITYVPVNKYGEADIEYLERSITTNTFLICVMHSNNELGVINNVARISEVAQRDGIHVHTDSVQSIGKTEFDVKKINCQSAALSSHKIYGPKGIGALYIKKDAQMDKFIHGGSQERMMRGGTENIPAIAGFKKAIEIIFDEMENDIRIYKTLKSRLLQKLKESFEHKITINSQEDGNSLHNIVNFSFDLSKVKIDPDLLVIRLDLEGIAVSSGSACTSGSIKPSHVLKELGYSNEEAKSSLRVSFGRFNTEDEVDYFAEKLKKQLVQGLKL